MITGRLGERAGQKERDRVNIVLLVSLGMFFPGDTSDRYSNSYIQ